jgi:hypothetical protein
MAPRRLHRRKEVHAKDPQVPLHGPTVRAVAEELGYSQAELARRTRDSPQAIAYHWKSDGMGKCRRSLRRKLARALDVSEELLAGEPVVLPHLAFVPRGFELLYSRHTELAASRLFTLVRAACLRDLEAWHRDHPNEAPDVDPMFAVHAVESHISDLLQIGAWRHGVVLWHPGEHERRKYAEPADLSPWPKVGDKQLLPPKPASDPDHERAVLALVHALEHVLGPWFDGIADLDFERLRLLTSLLRRARPAEEPGRAKPKPNPYAALLPPTAPTPPPAPPTARGAKRSPVRRKRR